MYALPRARNRAFGGGVRMRWLIVVMLVLVSACDTGTVPNSQPAGENVGYDITRDTDVAGRYHASGGYVPGRGVNADEVKWRALLNGLEAACKEGYDLVVWSGPKLWTLTQTAMYRGKTSTAQHLASYPGFAFVIQGYKAGGGHPPSAHPVGAVIDQINGEIAKTTR